MAKSNQMMMLKMIKLVLRKKKQFFQSLCSAIFHLDTQCTSQPQQTESFRFILVQEKVLDLFRSTQQKEWNYQNTFGLPSGVHSRLWALFCATSPLAPRTNRTRASTKVQEIVIFVFFFHGPIFAFFVACQLSGLWWITNGDAWFQNIPLHRVTQSTTH